MIGVGVIMIRTMGISIIGIGIIMDAVVNNVIGVIGISIIADIVMKICYNDENMDKSIMRLIL